jgi:hypothetical protein
LCVCDSEFQTRVAFAFLQKIQSRYQEGNVANLEEMLLQEMVQYSHKHTHTLSQTQFSLHLNEFETLGF